jgi:hypothetical protein
MIMIGNKLMSFVSLLAIGGVAIASAGSDDDGASHLNLRGAGGPYPAASEAASPAQAGTAGTVLPTTAETRHFAIYSRYRALNDSSGGSGLGTVKSSADEATRNSILWGSRLGGAEPVICSDPGSDK